MGCESLFMKVPWTKIHHPRKGMLIQNLKAEHHYSSIASHFLRNSMVKRRTSNPFLSLDLVSEKYLKEQSSEKKMARSDIMRNMIDRINESSILSYLGDYCQDIQEKCMSTNLKYHQNVTYWETDSLKKVRKTNIAEEYS